MNVLKWLGGSGKSATSGQTATDWLSLGQPTDKYWGLENVGNSCYCNSVVQSLYGCRAFREALESYSYPPAPPAQPQASIPPAGSVPSAAGPNVSASATPNVTTTATNGALSTSQTAQDTAAVPLIRKKSLLNASVFFKTAETVPPLPGEVATTAAAAEKNNKHTGKDKEDGTGVGTTIFRRQSSAKALTTPLQPPAQAPEQTAVTPTRSWFRDTSDITAFREDETLLTALQELFVKISSQKKKTGVLAPQQFMNKLRKENELFRSTQHQDAHEFLNFTLNAIAEILLKQKKELQEKMDEEAANEDNGGEKAKAEPTIEGSLPPPASWIHELFEGFLTNETKCLTCETVTNRDEAFLDLSVDIEQHSSVSSCLRNFSVSEMLCQRDKFFCNNCRSLQEAEKRMKIKKLPRILAVHLKRFKYQERAQRHVKLSYRVVFPMELRLFNTSDDAEDADRLYTLSSVVVHIGSGPSHGHYVTLVKAAANLWVLFDDENVEPVEESELQRYFGDPTSPGTAYILFYEEKREP